LRYEDYAMYAGYSELKCYAEAVKLEDSQEWQAAIDDEIKSLDENNTWELVDKPHDKMVINNWWVYRVKMNLDGTVDEVKARLVAKGYLQQAGVDHDEIFSPVARFDTICSVLGVAASEKLHLAQFDVKTAFLYGELDEVIYMRQPAGYEDGTDQLCKLNRSLYGLKQVPRCWNRKFKDSLKKHGLMVSEADPCVFYSTADGHKLIIVALYVDDGLVAAQNHGLSHRYDGSHHHDCDLLWARSPIHERHIRWQIWHSKLLVDGGPDLRRSRLASNS